MTKTESGEARSSLLTEQSAPEQNSSLSEEKKVSQVNNSSNPGRKRFILDCEENPDGSFSRCNLVPLNERKQPLPSIDKEKDSVTTSTDPQPEKVSENQCTRRKCKIPSSIRKRIAQVNAVPTEGDKSNR